MTDPLMPGVGEAQEPDLTVGVGRHQRAVVRYVDDHFWRCEVCGWLGQGLDSIVQAMREGKRHFEEMHPQEVVNVERKDLS